MQVPDEKKANDTKKEEKKPEVKKEEVKPKIEAKKEEVKPSNVSVAQKNITQAANITSNATAAIQVNKTQEKKPEAKQKEP